MPKSKRRAIAIIGFGAIAQTLVDVLCTVGVEETLVVLVRAHRQSDAQLQLDRIVKGRCSEARAISDVEVMFAADPHTVVECAGHEAVVQYAEPVLARGIDLIIASVGALADSGLFDTLKSVARQNDAQIILPSGAIGGIDALAAASLSGVERVIYTGRKPPTAWVGSPAENRVDLAGLSEETVFFEGTAREAASHFPKNANVAATLALAGLGMGKTEVRLIADPNVSENTHEYRVLSPIVDFSIVLTGKPSPLNPKTSQSTAYSLARAVLSRTEAVVI